ncbi:MAG: XcyI family restriction endonuclease [Acidobacteriota bacterium]
MSHHGQPPNANPRPAGRLVEISFATDPDVSIRERLKSGEYRNLVAIEIKGGSDRSNIHNRLGEAEKSHQKARLKKYAHCWTLVRVKELDEDLARKESPSTDLFFNIDEISSRRSRQHREFRDHLRALVDMKD